MTEEGENMIIKALDDLVYEIREQNKILIEIGKAYFKRK